MRQVNFADLYVCLFSLSQNLSIIWWKRAQWRKNLMVNKRSMCIIR